jgi:RHS repeat-associated protein
MMTPTQTTTYPAKTPTLHTAHPRRLQHGLTQALSRWLASLALLGTALVATQAPAQTVPGPASGSRSVVYERNPDTGAVTAETSNPSDPLHCLRKEYSYDTLGNQVSTTVKNCAGAAGDTIFSPRTSQEQYLAAGEATVGIFPNRATNAAGHAENRVHDNRFGLPTQVTDANGLVSTISYDSLGRKVTQVHPDGNKTLWRYEYCRLLFPGASPVGRCTPHIGPNGIPQPDVPNQAALRIFEQPVNAAGIPNGPQSITYYDPLGRVIQTQVQQYFAPYAPPVWSIVRTDYDALGRVARKSEPFFISQTPVWTTYTYDALGRLTDQSKPNVYATANGTSSAGTEVHTTRYYGRKTVATNPAGYTQSRELDEFGRTLRITDAHGSQQSYLFDAWGNLHQTKDALGHTTSIWHDQSGHKARMQDPDMGLWTYRHDPLGQLRTQTNPSGQTTTMAYDLLGRMTARAEPELKSSWYYDKTAAGGDCAGTVQVPTKGQLCESSTDTGYRRVNRFDALNRIIQSTTTLDTATTAYISKVAYNADGRMEQQTWPTGLAVKYQYHNTGELANIYLLGANGSLGHNLWSLQGKNARGQLDKVLFGNKLLTVSDFEPSTGLIRAITTGYTEANSSGNHVVNQSYYYNSLGHLTSRGNRLYLTGEVFSYDRLNRLTNQITSGPGISPGRSVSYRYNAIGNILENSDIGKYTYGTASAGTRPHALARINGQAGKLLHPQYHYDARGNILSVTSANGARRNHSWTSFDNPASFSLTSFNAQGAQEHAQMAFLYGPEHQRIRETSSKTVTSTAGNVTTYKTLAVLHPDNEGSLYFERETITQGRGGKVENRHYISAPNASGQGSGAFLVITSPGAIAADPVATELANTEQRYLHKDHLGSTIATTKPTYSGTVVIGATTIEQLAYEPFGKRRYPVGQFDQTGQIDATSTPRGFTGHEHLDDLDLIHMNARVYDPDIGRFLSPDPTVPYADNPQSFNRYSYTQNNPLNRVDRSGFQDVGLEEAQSALSRATQYGSTSEVRAAEKQVEVAQAAHDRKTAAMPSSGTSIAESQIQLAQAYSVGLAISRGGESVLMTVWEEGKAWLAGAAVGGVAAAGSVKYASQIKAAGGSLWQKAKALFTNTAAKAKGQTDDAAKVVAAEVRPVITVPYKRPSGATTKAQRQSVQGQPCVDCGQTTSRQFADHKKPLVKEYYETGTIDKEKMRSLDAVQPQCQSCSGKQGAELKSYSQDKKEELGL